MKNRRITLLNKNNIILVSAIAFFAVAFTIGLIRLNDTGTEQEKAEDCLITTMQDETKDVTQDEKDIDAGGGFDDTDYEDELVSEDTDTTSTEEEETQESSATEEDTESDNTIDSLTTDSDSETGSDDDSDIETYTESIADTPSITYTGSDGFKVKTLSEETIDIIDGVSFKENDKVELNDLRLVEVRHYGFDDNIHSGELIVHKKVAEEVCDIFEELLQAEFPIEKIRLIDEYGADDDLSMEDNNSSALCVRYITGTGNVFSNHSYGIAIDINPIQNPYVRGDTVLPPEGEDYLDRSQNKKGMIRPGDACYTAFKSRGWTWGGDWRSLKDYMHFEKSIAF